MTIQIPIISLAQHAVNPLQPSIQVFTSAKYMPIHLLGMTLDSKDPFKIDFIVNTGDSSLTENEIKDEARKLIRYFLTAVTIPENEQWVNLSPNEPDRIITEKFSFTEMGRDLLAQDYLLKQLSASITNPETELGQIYWNQLNRIQNEFFKETDIPLNTFNKIWIMPDKAEIYSHERTVVIVDSHLRLMLDEDLGFINETDNHRETNSLNNRLPEKLKNEILNAIRINVLPVLENEINYGENFAVVRQIYHSMILATWFKRNLRSSLYGDLYISKNKISGVDLVDKNSKQEIYDNYLLAFKKGAYNIIKEEYDARNQNIISRKYFSGGYKNNLSLQITDKATLSQAWKSLESSFSKLLLVGVSILPLMQGVDVKAEDTSAYQGENSLMTESLANSSAWINNHETLKMYTTQSVEFKKPIDILSEVSRVISNNNLSVVTEKIPTGGYTWNFASDEISKKFHGITDINGTQREWALGLLWQFAHSVSESTMGINRIEQILNEDRRKLIEELQPDQDPIARIFAFARLSSYEDDVVKKLYRSIMQKDPNINFRVVAGARLAEMKDLSSIGPMIDILQNPSEMAGGFYHNLNFYSHELVVKELKRRNMLTSTRPKLKVLPTTRDNKTAVKVLTIDVNRLQGEHRDLVAEHIKKFLELHNRPPPIIESKIENFWADASQSIDELRDLVDRNPNTLYVVNVSLGNEGSNFDPYKVAGLFSVESIIELGRKGVIFVFAIGNEGDNTNGLKYELYENRPDNVIFVSGSEDNGKTAVYYSSYGPMVDVVLNVYPYLQDKELHGTSFAAPVGTGTIYDYLVSNPTVSPAAAVNWFLQLSQPMKEDPKWAKEWLGLGYIDTDDLYNKAKNIEPVSNETSSESKTLLDKPKDWNTGGIEMNPTFLTLNVTGNQSFTMSYGNISLFSEQISGFVPVINSMENWSLNIMSQIFNH